MSGEARVTKTPEERRATKRAYDKERYKKNKKRISECNAKYYKEHRAAVLATVRRYQTTERGQAVCQAAGRRYRMSEKGQIRDDRAHAKEALWAHVPPRALTRPVPIPEARRVVVLSDIQLPFEDQHALELALRFTLDYRPDLVVLNGDIVDCYDLSDFDRDPKNSNTLNEEAWLAGELMRVLRPAVDRVVWLGGNHEYRWTRQLNRIRLNNNKAPLPILALALERAGGQIDDPDESFRALFETTKHGVEFHPYGHYILLCRDKLVLTHGFTVCKHSAYSAKAAYERLGRSCIIGHTHRLGNYMATNLDGPHGAWENGCLSSLQPEYVQFPNWQQGFNVVTITDTGYFHVTQVPIIKEGETTYSLRHEGQEWRVG